MAALPPHRLGAQARDLQGLGLFLLVSRPTLNWAPAVCQVHCAVPARTEFS